jgi:CBS domain-containing membrane protein
MAANTNLALTREDYLKALREMDSFIDITVDDLMKLNETAAKYAQLRTAHGVLARDVMTRDPVTIEPEASVTRAADLLLEHNISGLPVLDTAGKLQGIITEADLLCALGLPCHHPTQTLWQTLEALFTHHPSPGLDGPVADIMVRKVITVAETDSLHDVIETMKKGHIKRVAVTDADNHVTGIITRSNLVRVFLEKAREAQDDRR